MDDDPLCPGAWQVITGTTELGESIRAAATRELAEETGLVAEQWIVTGRVATFYFEPFNAIVHSPVLLCEIAIGDEPVLSTEHSEHRWCPTAEAIDLLEFATHREGVALVVDITAKPR